MSGKKKNGRGRQMDIQWVRHTARQKRKRKRSYKHIDKQPVYLRITEEE